MTPQEKADKARRRAIRAYEYYAKSALKGGDSIADTDPAGAVNYWLAGMSALDAAETAAKGLSDNPWKGTVFGHE